MRASSRASTSERPRSRMAACGRFGRSARGETWSATRPRSAGCTSRTRAVSASRASTRPSRGSRHSVTSCPTGRSAARSARRSIACRGRNRRRRGSLPAKLPAIGAASSSRRATSSGPSRRGSSSRRMGARSVLRAQAGIGADRWDYEQTAIVTTAATQRFHDHVAYERFTHDGPIAVLPSATGAVSSGRSDRRSGSRTRARRCDVHRRVADRIRHAAPVASCRSVRGTRIRSR